MYASIHHRRSLTLACLVASLLASTQAAYAISCRTAINRAQVRLDAKLATHAAAGRVLRETTFATMGHQPSPTTIAQAEAAAGIWAAGRRAQASLERARSAEMNNDQRRCFRAVRAAYREERSSSSPGR
jgi:hypothetical protein